MSFKKKLSYNHFYTSLNLWLKHAPTTFIIEGHKLPNKSLNSPSSIHLP